MILPGATFDVRASSRGCMTHGIFELSVHEARCVSVCTARAYRTRGEAEISCPYETAPETGCKGDGIWWHQESFSKNIAVKEKAEKYVKEKAEKHVKEKAEKHGQAESTPRSLLQNFLHNRASQHRPSTCCG